MKQLIQSLKTGEVELAEIPVPEVKPGYLLIKSSRSVVSLGTERMLVEFGKAGWLNKARQQPDKVKQVLQKIRTDGVGPTVRSVSNKLNQPIALGYSNVGPVLEVGNGVSGYKAGDRVLSNGRHAEVVCIPEHLCARVPDQVDDETAAFGVVCSIALQGVRLAEPTLGETFAVLGLGLIGLLAVQVLQANGCRVIGFDFDSRKVELAREFGADACVLDKNTDSVAVAHELTNGTGVDGVLICAATRSNDPIEQAPKMCRKRGRVILLGVVGLELSRAGFFEKEITFQVSCSYGPGRYDDRYESKGLDYPIGFVRWTEQRNFEAVLQLMARGLLRTENLITKRILLEEAPQLYAGIGQESGLGYLIEYPGDVDLGQKVVVLNRERSAASAARCVAGFIGAGAFAAGTLISAFKESGARLKMISSASGITGNHQGRKQGFEAVATDYRAILNDPEINTVVIATRHNSHARFVVESLNAGKHVFVEKPLCLNLEELDEIQAAYSSLLMAHGKEGWKDKIQAPHQPSATSHQLLMVGFNKRFSPLISKMKQLLETQSGPKAMIMTVNAGAIPSDHWTQDPEVGGGRLIGEACHYVDLFRYLAGSEITSRHVVRSSGGTRDTMSLQLTSKDGSIGSVHYFANGNKSFSKDRLEVFCAGKVLQMDNFRTLKGFGWKGFKRTSLRQQDKGHSSEVKAFVSAIEAGTNAPIPFEEIVEVARVSLELGGK